jgi:VCBS repeat-containing protein
VDIVFATSANAPPAAANDSYTVTQGQTLNVAAPGVLANDTSFTGNPLTAINPTTPANGTLTFNTNGSFTYTPNASFVGADTFTYQASDGIAVSNVATVTISVMPAGTPVTIFSPSSVPGTADANDSASVELGVKFRVSTPGFVSAVRFYKGTLNTGTHIGNLWTSTGTLVATATFTSETASGWQQVSFTTPVAISSNTTYIASYFAPKGEYAADQNFFATAGVTNGPLTALANGVDGGNGVFNYSSASSFPTQTFNSTNYWVDLVFTASSSTPPIANNDSYSTTQGMALSIAAPGVLGNDTSPSGSPLTAIKVTDPANGTLTLNADGSFVYTPNSTFTGTDSFTYKASDGVSTSNVATVTITVTSASLVSIWSPSTVPGTADANDSGAVELGLKFQANVAGSVVGVRFYKGSLNTGTHVGNLWTNTGMLLATATFVNESASGWQQVNFATPVSISANTTYVVSYFAPHGEYAFDSNYFASAGVTNGPLHALANSEDPGGNGVYHYGSASSFPTQTFNAGNYWVDVVFTH